MISLVTRVFVRSSCYSTTAPLPELPVPKLEHSLSKFQDTILPVLSEDEYSRICLLIKKFSKEDAPYLQTKLMQFAREKTNWAADIFVYDRYLSNRNSLVYSSPVLFVKERSNCASEADMLSVASQYISAFLKMQKDIRLDRLPQDMRGTTPLCMKQYNQLLGAYRVPGVEADKLSFSPSSRYIVVMYAGHVYKLPVFKNENRELLSVHDIYQLLSQMLHQVGSIGPSVSILTTLDRAEWYSAREELRQSPVNAASLEEIEGSLFGVCLGERQGASVMAAIKQTAIGGQLPFNCWHDLGNQLIVTRDGCIGIVYDHASRDGNLKLPMFNFKNDIELNTRITDSLRVEKLDWDLSHASKLHIEKARRKLVRVSTKCDSHLLTFTNFGADFIKEQNLHPNGYIQMATQLAYYQLYGSLVPCHHPVSLKKFTGGRLEQPFTITGESKAFIKAFLSREKSDSQKRSFLNRAVAKHREIINGTFNGDATNKHIRGLKLLAEKEGMSVDLFRDDTFVYLFNNKFYTAHGYNHLDIHAFNFPRSLEGQFIYTILKNHKFNISVTSILNSPNSHTAIHFSQAIEDSLLRIKQLVEKTN